MITSEIKILPGFAVIRQRPEMFVGNLNDPLLPNMLLKEALCCARDDALAGLCKRVDVTLFAGGRCVMRDNGPGLPLDVQADGRRLLQHYLCDLSACASGKSSQQIAQSTCTIGLAVVNALSSSLTVRVFQNGTEWTQNYVEGQAITELETVGATTDQGTELTFQLDKAILPFFEFKLAEFLQWVATDVTGLEVVVIETGAA